MKGRYLLLFLFVLLISALPLSVLVSSATINVTVQTDKSTYTLGELVSIAGNVTSDGSPVAGVYVGIEVDKPDGSPIFVDQVQTDSNGSFLTNFTLPTDAPVGRYNVTATYGGSQAFSHFDVVVKGFGLLRVQSIPAVVTTIFVDGRPRNDWGLDWVKMPPGSYRLSFTDVPGFITPEHVNVTFYPPGGVPTKVLLSESIPIYANVTTEVKVYFIQAGYLRVETSPPLPATIYVDGYPMNDWGLWVTLKPSNYTVSFQDVEGFVTPGSITVEVRPGVTTHVVGNYTSGKTVVLSG
jgi:hypothetical protein